MIFKNGTTKDLVETYRDYYIYKITTPAKQTIYNANSVNPNIHQLITCVGETLEQTKAEIDGVHARIKLIGLYYDRNQGLRR